MVEDRVRPGFARPESYSEALQGIIGQDDLKRKLASAFSQYSLYLTDPSVGKPVVLIAGGSGTGKTESVERIAHSAGMPYTSVSGSGLSPPGYKGMTLRELLAQHMLKQKVDYGVIYVDEIDKWCPISSRGDKERAGIGLGMQSNALRMIESEEIYLSDEMEPEEGETDEDITIHTKNLLWIFTGAFDGITMLAKRRFHHHFPEEDLWGELQPKDFIRYGLLAEFAGRVTTWAWTKPLKRREMIEIMQLQDVPRWRTLFKAIGCEVEIDEGALAQCVDRAYQQKTGVRGAKAFLQHSMEDVYAEASKYRIEHVKVDVGLVTTGHLEIPEEKDDVLQLPVSAVQ